MLAGIMCSRSKDEVSGSPYSFEFLDLFNSLSFPSKINGVVSGDWLGFSRAVGFVGGFTCCPALSQF